MEYMDLGTLGDISKLYGQIPEVMLGLIAYQVFIAPSIKKVLNGMEYLHKTIKLIHRDIKPSNLLVNSNGLIKISDFGVSGQLMNSRDQRSTWIGTVTYMSPERLRGGMHCRMQGRTLLMGHGSMVARLDSTWVRMGPLPLP